MATRDTLIFSGRRWPGVRRLASNEELGYVAPQQLWQFAFTAAGDGQGWHTEQPLALWRSYAEIPADASDATSIEKALRFLRRHGDPFGELDNGNPVSTNKDWPDLTSAFSSIAGAWGSPDASKTSFISNDPERLAAAQAALFELAPPYKQGLPGIQSIAQGSALVPRATTFRAFMIASAASALRRRIAMRVCARCGDWFELRRTDALYCSGSCQAADHKQRAAAGETTAPETTSYKPKGPSHGKRTKAKPPRSDRLPRGVARKRSRRKGTP